MTKQFIPEKWKKKEPNTMGNLGLREREMFENQLGVAVKILFVNLSIGKQKTAKNFWLSLKNELSLEEIITRVEKGFGDLNEVEK